MLPRLTCLVAVVLFAGCLDGSVLDRDRPLTQEERVARLLTNDVDTRIAILPYYVPGREPVPAAMDWLASRLKDVTGKLEVRVAPAIAINTGTDSPDTNWTSERALAVFEGLDVPSQAGTFPLVMIFFDGYGHNGVTTAAGWQNERYIAIFPDAFRGTGVTDPVDLVIPVPDPDGRADRQVMLHEAGHMLGLVDHGAPMQRDHVDRSDPCLCHSDNDASIMFPSVDNVLSQAERAIRDRELKERDFDADDLADLRAFQQAHGG